MSATSGVIAQPNRLQWYILTGFGLALLRAVFHPVTVLVSVVTHWYCRRNERLKIFIWGRRRFCPPHLASHQATGNSKILAAIFITHP